MRPLAVFAVLTMMVQSSARAQVRADPGTVIAGRVAVRVYVTLSDDETPYFPVGGLQLRFFRSATDSIVAITDGSGTATVLLAPGDYRLVSARATTWKGNRYSWSVPITVRAGMPILDLQPPLASVQPIAIAASLPPAPAISPTSRTRPAPYIQPSALSASAAAQSTFVGAADIVARASLDGARTADMRGTGSHFAGGFVGGVLLGLIGTVIAYASADADAPDVPIKPPPIYADTSATYLLAFRRGYDDRLRARRKSAALGGGLLGTAVAVVAVVSYLNSQSDY